MASCDRGYICAACRGEVEEIPDSSLYLAYILGEVVAEDLLRTPECHIRCNLERAQYIIDPAFEPIICEGPFDKRGLDAAYVAEEEVRVTRAWRRLQEVTRLGVPIGEYPLK